MRLSTRMLELARRGAEIEITELRERISAIYETFPDLRDEGAASVERNGHSNGTTGDVIDSHASGFLLALRSLRDSPKLSSEIPVSTGQRRGTAIGQLLRWRYALREADGRLRLTRKGRRRLRELIEHVEA